MLPRLAYQVLVIVFFNRTIMTMERIFIDEMLLIFYNFRYISYSSIIFTIQFLGLFVFAFNIRVFWCLLMKTRSMYTRSNNIKNEDIPFHNLGNVRPRRSDNVSLSEDDFVSIENIDKLLTHLTLPT